MPFEISTVEAFEVLRPLTLFVLGMTVYAIFVFKFYRFLARKDILLLDLARHNNSRFKFIRKITGFVFYVGKYLIVFPVFAFFWFLVLTLLLSFMAKNQTIENTLLVSMTVVGAVRITAYYSEDLSRDLAKILPFALLGIFLVDSSFFSVPLTLERIEDATTRWDVMFYYLMAIVALEVILRLGSSMLSSVFSLINALEERAEESKIQAAARRRRGALIENREAPWTGQEAIESERPG